MEKLRVNNTPVRTSRNFLINNLEVELEIPQKDEFTNLKIINEKSKIFRIYRSIWILNWCSCYFSNEPNKCFC